MLCDQYNRSNLENSSGLIQHYILNKKHWMQLYWLSKLKSEHWAYTCTYLCTNGEMMITINNAGLQSIVWEENHMFVATSSFLHSLTWFREWIKLTPASSQFGYCVFELHSPHPHVSPLLVPFCYSEDSNRPKLLDSWAEGVSCVHEPSS